MYFYLEYDACIKVHDEPKITPIHPSVQLFVVTMGRKFSLSRRVKNYERKTRALKKRPSGRPRKIHAQPHPQLHEQPTVYEQVYSYSYKQRLYLTL